ncbi:MAG: manganese catalase family protein [Clostridia bacterium]|nr:manganese catalase family protein [Clostridia bacterium]
MIKVQLPYPSVESFSPDYKSACVIAPSYCGIHGELDAILQYVYHGFYFNKIGDKQTADVMIGIAMCEMQHFEMLGSALLKLGIDPTFTKQPCIRSGAYNTSYISYSKSPVKMLIDDITGEMVAISEYEKTCERLQNEEVGALIKRIILDEQLHVKVLKERLEEQNVAK